MNEENFEFKDDINWEEIEQYATVVIERIQDMEFLLENDEKIQIYKDINKLLINIENKKDKYTSEIDVISNGIIVDFDWILSIKNEKEKEEEFIRTKNKTKLSIIISNKIKTIEHVYRKLIIANSKLSCRLLEENIHISRRNQPNIQVSYETKIPLATTELKCEICMEHMAKICHECLNQVKEKEVEDYVSGHITKEIPNTEIDKEKNKIKDKNNIYVDEYYWIELFAENNDGSIQHQKSELIRNFEKMSPPCTSPIATAYVIDAENITKLNLKGLIRYNKRSNNYKISPSQSIFNNKIKREGTKIQTAREKIITRLGEKRNKIRQTQIELINNKYKILQDIGNISGSGLEYFL